jgi:uncharacterized repeat protein (TIGR03803 family)
MSKFNWGMRACGIFLLWATAVVALPAQTTGIPEPAVTFKTLYSFKGTDGQWPAAELVQGTNGNLYGTTYVGGTSTRCHPNPGCGNVFKITSSGVLTTLHSFDVADGQYPLAGLIQATNGSLYGTTYEGGPSNSNGTVFKITPSGMLTTLHNFEFFTDGADPLAALIQGTDGKFYGTTFYGGADNLGTVFKITPSGMLTTLLMFDATDGNGPRAGLVQTTNGGFYGTTLGGGAYRSGAVFRITPQGTVDTLYSFCRQSGCPDGNLLYAGLVQGSDGNFYGTTYEGGTYGNGTVFVITPTGALTTLHSFDDTDGAFPDAALFQATDGNLYGTTGAGGANANSSCTDGCGTLFRITPSGSLSTLYNFCSRSGCTDGQSPKAALIQDTNGKFYGTTELGGANNACEYGCGTVFSLSVGLGPFVKTNPTSGAVGAAVKILGTSLTGATSVAFNGTPATFTVVRKSLIKTTVPAGATTGTVEVVTPGGTLSSNVPFRVK